jgi:hypothetical protein
MTKTIHGSLAKGIAFAAGMVSNGHLGSADLEEGLGLILLGLLLGAFCGLLFGLMATHVLRYVAFLMGKHTVGHAVTICCALLGAVLFAFLAATSDGQD